MFYQCGKCSAIHENINKARECCQPYINTLNINEVQACVHHDPLASVCMICKGTGLIKRIPGLMEIIKK